MWGECPDEHIEDYIDAYGLLMEDLEVMHGAYREDNHNCKMFYLLTSHINHSYQAVFCFFFTDFNKLIKPCC